MTIPPSRSAGLPTSPVDEARDTLQEAGLLDVYVHEPNKSKRDLPSRFCGPTEGESRFVTNTTFSAACPSPGPSTRRPASPRKSNATNRLRGRHFPRLSATLLPSMNLVRQPNRPSLNLNLPKQHTPSSLRTLFRTPRNRLARGCEALGVSRNPPPRPPLCHGGGTPGWVGR